MCYAGAMRRFTDMKNSYPGIKTMVSIGGWSEGSEKFSQVRITLIKRPRGKESMDNTKIGKERGNSHLKNEEICG